jgi:predicted ATPase
MLRRIHIKGYKSLADVEFTLEPLAVLFGPNASGKSNFLDALQLLSRIATSRTLKEAFEPPYRGTPLESFAFHPAGVKGLLRREQASFTIEADVDLSASVVEAVNREIHDMKAGKSGTAQARQIGRASKTGEARAALPLVRETSLRYRIQVEVLPKTGVLRVVDEYLAALTRKGGPKSSRKPFLEPEGDRLCLRMERQGHPVYYDLGLSHAIISQPLFPPHCPHVVAMRRELESWLFFYFEPRERMRLPNPVKEVRHIGLMGEDLAAFLNTLKAFDPAQFDAVQKALRMIIPSVTGIDVGVNDLGEVDLWVKEGDMPVPARVVSEGTLRVLGLLALGGTRKPPALIGFEEPENGIHPRRIRLVAELLKSRASSRSTQIIVTTHSPILLDLIQDKYLHVCRKTEEGTQIEPFTTWGPLGKKRDVATALDANGETLPVSERILRGDFDA